MLSLLKFLLLVKDLDLDMFMLRLYYKMIYHVLFLIVKHVNP